MRRDDRHKKMTGRSGAMSACGRKQPVDYLDFQRFE